MRRNQENSSVAVGCQWAIATIEKMNLKKIPIFKHKLNASLKGI
ncbi:hypothetical protein NIES970_16960 [[Synechococcus] sp. NIES-970]|nr:hypothetical protein NIES970_16960 [[Synechococcus] sp. NIES-970]